MDTNIIAYPLRRIKKGYANMKQLTSYNRVAGYLNKIFDLLNAEYFENEQLSLFSTSDTLPEKIAN